MLHGARSMPWALWRPSRVDRAVARARSRSHRPDAGPRLRSGRRASSRPAGGAVCRSSRGFTPSSASAAAAWARSSSFATCASTASSRRRSSARTQRCLPASGHSRRGALPRALLRSPHRAAARIPAGGDPPVLIMEHVEGFELGRIGPSLEFPPARARPARGLPGDRPCACTGHPAPRPQAVEHHARRAAGRRASSTSA